MIHRKNVNRAIWILEAPWGLDAQDSNRASVLPFIEGVGKHLPNIEVFHANFYDKSSFEKAFDCLSKCKSLNTTVYIAAHGSKKKIGGVNIIDLLITIARKSVEFNITGVMLGSCYAGGNTSTMEVCIQESKIKWCAGYSASCNWLEGTMIDCSIIAAMTNINRLSTCDSEDTLVDALSRALAPFSTAYYIGKNYSNQPHALGDSMEFVVQPSGQGKKARTVTKKVFDKCNMYLKPATT